MHVCGHGREGAKISEKLRTSFVNGPTMNEEGVQQIQELDGKLLR